jgi:hypothetical protein
MAAHQTTLPEEYRIYCVNPQAYSLGYSCTTHYPLLQIHDQKLASQDLGKIASFPPLSKTDPLSFLCSLGDDLPYSQI